MIGCNLILSTLTGHLYFWIFGSYSVLFPQCYYVREPISGKLASLTKRENINVISGFCDGKPLQLKIRSYAYPHLPPLIEKTLCLLRIALLWQLFVALAKCHWLRDFKDRTGHRHHSYDLLFWSHPEALPSEKLDGNRGCFWLAAHGANEPR